jgi:hypothetical protein
MCCHDHRDGFRGPHRDEHRSREDRCCHGHDDSRGCCPDHEEGGFGLKRHFRSKAEMIAALEAYLKELESEAQGVREAIEELKA